MGEKEEEAPVAGRLRYVAGREEEHETESARLYQRAGDDDGDIRPRRESNPTPNSSCLIGFRQRTLMSAMTRELLAGCPASNDSKDLIALLRVMFVWFSL